MFHCNWLAILIFCYCFLQGLFVTRSFPPIEAPEDEDTENLGGNESDGEASIGDKAGDGENTNELVVEQHILSADASNDTESSPTADHDDRADGVLIPDAAPSADASASQKRSAGGFVDEDSLFDE